MNQDIHKYNFETFRGKELFLVSALQESLEDGCASHVETILQRTEASPNMVIPLLGVTPFHLAVGNESENFSEEVTRLFLRYGGNPNVRSSGGQTPVHVAAAWGRVNLVRLLLVNGGNPWLRDEDDNNAFLLAFEGKHWEVIEVLESFRLSDQNRDEDSNQEKYKLTLDKVLVYNKSVAFEYGEISCSKGNTENARTVGTQTSGTIRNYHSFSDENNMNDKASSVSKVAVGKSIAKIFKNEIGDSQLNDKEPVIRRISNEIKSKKEICTHENFNKETPKNKHLMFPSKSLKELLLDELKKFNIKRNSEEFSFDPKQKTGGCNDKILNEQNKTKIPQDTVEFQSKNHSDMPKTLDSNSKIYSLMRPKSELNISGINALDDSTLNASEQKDCVKTVSENVNNAHGCIKNDEISDSKSTITSLNLRMNAVCDSKNLIKTNNMCENNEQKNDILYFNNAMMDYLTDDLSSFDLLPDEWVASQSCFDNSDYITCDEDNPVLVDPSIDTFHVPEKCIGSSNCKIQGPGPTDKVQCHNISASSSGESFVTLSEEYKYSDEEEGVVLFEKIFLVPPVSITCLQGETGNGSKHSSEASGIGHSVTSDCSSVPSSLDYDTDVLRNKLKERGYIPGPIVPTTKRIYLRKLVKLEKKPMKVLEDIRARVYSPELQRTLLGFRWQSKLTEYLKLEKEVSQQFSQPEPERRWREGNIKSSFTYLLLDPRITNNLPCRLETLDRMQVWSTFLSSIFYVGKGKRSRPYAHLYQAFNVWNKQNMNTVDKKVNYILSIWKSGMGVVCLHVFQNVIPVEAYTREAAMIDAIGLNNLKNMKSGEYYGIASTWTSHQKRMLGTFLLYRAMLIFLHEGERQLRPGDIA